MTLSLTRKKQLLFGASLLPLLGFVVQQLVSGGGPDPGKDLVLLTGDWTIRMLLITLAVTPARRLLHKPQLLAYRRMLGLFTGFYAMLHFTAVMTYVVGWNWGRFLEEFSERPYMAVGILAWLLLLPLIATSNQWSLRHLRQRWNKLHKLVYVIAILGVVHVVWLVRSNYAEALVYALLTLLLLGYRLLPSRTARKHRAPVS
ncbi:sulfite oxidase heme-binding subunit YedZ [Pseudomaricurvus sp. HS19]|uniref:sulfite oxidase heme-binding subunit YedZ n=1 Tax=Pseudomaricurvus sp. HS19 TaxID=2692626 RepID=UPI00136961B0|nr:protein-methionine-sulfoxide reductase heme-binding subunit MsrQ [Pseudomaricurvus sp. HS19]MYM64433.1 sulfoxide reductase heme-binding subunit YedZ [Pseudomaricurvus sp. HS19]